MAQNLALLPRQNFGLAKFAWLVKFCLAGLGKTITLGFYRIWHIYT
jgi:hypothetical protein